MQIDKKAKNALIIVNPVSGLGDPKKRVSDIQEISKELGWDGELAETTLKTTAKLIAQKAIRKGVKYIIVCGGDGTIMEVLVAAVKKPVKIGIVPMGTGNLFARNLDIPIDTKEALKKAFLGKAEKIDVGVANGIYFSITTGMGIDVDMIKDATRDLKNKLGFFAYIFAGLKNLNKKPGLYRIIIDGHKTKSIRAKSVMVANMGKIPGGIKFVPGAHPKNGVLKIGIIQANDPLSTASIGINAVRGNVNKSSHYKLYKGKNIEIVPLKGKESYQCDGNAFPPTSKLKVTIYPKSVSIMLSG